MVLRYTGHEKEKDLHSMLKSYLFASVDARVGVIMLMATRILLCTRFSLPVCVRCFAPIPLPAGHTHLLGMLICWFR